MNIITKVKIMRLEHYKFTTSTKQFESYDVDKYHLKYHLKEQNGVFYAREHENHNWSKLEKLEKKVCICDKYGGLVYVLNIILLVIICSYCFNLDSKNTLMFVLMGSLYGFPLCWVGLLINWYKSLSDKEIKEIIEKNKSSFTSGASSDSYKKHSSRGGYSDGPRSSSYSGGSSGGGYGTSSSYISSSDLDKALNDMESKGKSWEDLANFTTDEERKKLFTEYFKDKEKGEAANDKFNREQLGPARKRTLNKIFAEAEYEDDETKENLRKKIDNFDNTISNDEFQTTVKEIRKFQERKKLKDNHLKYEGRLSNKDVKAIKDVLGYVCMGCGLDPVKEYGSEMKGILEAHHKKPWAEIAENEVRTVEPNDFYILCPNCHRMIHRLDSSDDLDGLKEVLNQNKKSHWWD